MDTLRIENEGSDHDIFILRDSSSSASSLSYSRADVLLAAVEMRLLDGPFPLPSSGHDSLCMIDSDTIIMTDSHLGNHLVEKFSENKTSAPIEACFTTMCAGNSNGLAIRINSGTDPTGPFHGELPFRSLLLHPSCEPE